MMQIMLTSGPLQSLALHAAAILVLSAQAMPIGHETRGPFDGIPGVTIVDYDVAGRTPKAIRHSIDAARPTDTNDGTRVDGLSRWNVRWRWQNDGRGHCSTTQEDISFSATVTVPRLSDAKVSPAVQEQFDRYRKSLLAHEEGHVRYAWDHRNDIVKAINTAGCDKAGAAAKAALAIIASHDVAFDRETHHGGSTIAAFG
ncbi:DUF922 domain-containing protein [Sphingomonas sp. MA1305]|uniref:DUF922 domain-containing protein n=1 Tax=Sphingomonas sp. MA1305 TaxID=2479204 RepID=UPI001E470C33|nr:DUF922 domain-containing protein [Sphingomonas sp. MA1305]MBI0475092.1 DUF922 domain-containing protein [Sphingomonas sp. MA1305]